MEIQRNYLFKVHVIGSVYFAYYVALSTSWCCF